MPPFEFNRYCSCARCRIHGLMGPAIIVTVGVLLLLRSFDRFYMDELWPGALMLVIGFILLGSRTASVAGHVPPGRPAVMPPQYQYPPPQYQYPPQTATGASVPPPPAVEPQPNDQQVKP